MHGYFMDIRLYHKVKKDASCQFLFLTMKYMCWGFLCLFVVFFGLAGVFSIQIVDCVLY